MNTKLAVVFPGVGYHTDKPLLYHSKKIALSYGYEIRDVPYGNFPAGVKGDKDKMRKAFYDALAQSEEILRDVNYGQYEEVLFLSKSIGTAIPLRLEAERIILESAEKYGVKCELEVRGGCSCADSSEKLSREILETFQKSGLYENCVFHQPFGASDDTTEFMTMVQENGDRLHICCSDAVNAVRLRD